MMNNYSGSGFNSFKLFFLLTVTSVLFACNKDKVTGSGNTISDNRQYTNFTGVSVSGSTRAFIRQDSVFTVSIKGYENLVPYIETKIVNGVLQVGYRNNVNVRNDNTEVYVTMPALNYLQTSGSGDMSVSGPFTGGANFKAAISGSSNINIESGSADKFEGDISGSGKIVALGFQSNESTANLSGSGEMEISVRDRLHVNISGSGKVYYRGSPVITTNISGSGQVIPK